MMAATRRQGTWSWSPGSRPGGVGVTNVGEVAGGTRERFEVREKIVYFREAADRTEMAARNPRVTRSYPL